MQRALVLFDYQASRDDEISIVKGDVVDVKEAYDDGWWLIETDRHIMGLVPANYMTPYPLLPPGWKSAVDVETNEKYFYSTSGVVQWEFPTSFLPSHNSTSSKDMKRLIDLRQQAEAKINALREAVSKVDMDSNELSTRSMATSRDINEGNEFKTKMPTSQIIRKSTPPGPASSKSRLPKPVSSKVQPVISNASSSGAVRDQRFQSASYLNPDALNLIYEMIDNRINNEFAVRDAELLGKMREMMSRRDGTMDIMETHADNAVIDDEDGKETAARSRSTRQQQQHNESSGSKHAAKDRFPVESLNFDEKINDDLQSSKARKIESSSPAKNNPPRVNGNGASPRVAHHKAVDVGGGGGGIQQHRSPHCRRSPTVYAPSSVIAAEYCQATKQPALALPKIASAMHVKAPAATAACLSLHHIYGYRGDTAIKGKNILMVGERWIVFPAAAVVVLMNIVDHEQAFLTGHSEDVTCLALHPSSSIAASGQMGADNSLFVWDLSFVKDQLSVSHTRTMEKSLITRLKTPQGIRGVVNADFSGDGRFLLAVGVDESHSILVFDWRSSAIVCSAKVGHTDVSFVGFNVHQYYAKGTSRRDKQHAVAMASAPSTMPDCYTLVSVGGKQIKFWTLSQRSEASLQADEESNSYRQNSSFKSRKLPVRKHAFRASSVGRIETSFVLEGCLASASSKSIVNNSENAFPELSSCCFIGFPSYSKSSRVLTGTVLGSVFIWEQLSNSKRNNQQPWLSKGKLLTVVTDLHDHPIADLSFNCLGLDRGLLVSSDVNGCVSMWNVFAAGLVEADGSSSAVAVNSINDAPIQFVCSGSLAGGGGDSDDAGGELDDVSAREFARCVILGAHGTVVIAGTTKHGIVRLRMEHQHSLHAPSSLTNGADVERNDAIVHEDIKLVVHSIAKSNVGKVRKVISHPLLNIFACISTNKSLSIFDASTYRQLSVLKLSDGNATCLIFDQSGKKLAVGNEIGLLTIYESPMLNNIIDSLKKNPELHTSIGLNDFKVPGNVTCHLPEHGIGDWRIIYKRKLAAKPSTGYDEGYSKPLRRKLEIVELSFSPLGDVIALCCKDNLIHLLREVKGGNGNMYFKHFSVCRGHTAYVKNIDFSVDGNIIQSVDAAKELLHWRVSTGERLSNPADFRDVQWKTFTCTYGWHVQGIFNNHTGQPSMDSDVNCVARAFDNKFIVVGTSDTVQNSVRVFPFPCGASAVPSVHGGHTSPVLAAAFLQPTPAVTSVIPGNTNEMVLTAGGNDSCIFQWKFIRNRDYLT